MPELKLSPGLVQGAIELLEISVRHKLTFVEIASSIRSLGNMPVPLVCEVSQVLNWITVDQADCIKATEAGQRVIANSSYQYRLRQAILDYIEVVKPAWLQSVTYGRKRVLKFVGLQLEQVFAEAGLVDGVDADVISFWDVLAAAARGRKNDQTTAIGRRGERLSFLFEGKRTGRRPIWIAIDNNADGYDVLSIVNRKDTRMLSIEVKTSTMGLSGSIHITRNEWDRAMEVENHCFHLWSLKDGEAPKLATLEPAQLEIHIPSDTGYGQWESVEIPFKAFARELAPVTGDQL